MSVGLNDLQPQNISVNVKGVQLTSKPLRLKHALILAKVGNIFQNADKATVKDIDEAQKDIDAVFTELIPELKGIELDMSTTIKLLTDLMATIEPEDNKEIKEAGIEFNTDPKVEGIG